MCKLSFKETEVPEMKLPTSVGLWTKQGSIYFCFTDHTEIFDFMDHNKLWKILKEMGVSDHLTCLLRNLYAGQEATARTGHGTMISSHDWEPTGAS